MSVVDSATATLRVHDFVEFQIDVLTAKRGMRGTIVSAHPDRDTYTVEIADEDRAGKPNLVPAHRRDLKLLERAV